MKKLFHSKKLPVLLIVFTFLLIAGCAAVSNVSSVWPGLLVVLLSFSVLFSSCKLNKKNKSNRQSANPPVIADCNYSNIDLSTLAAAEGFRIDGVNDNDYSGWSVSSAGDINGDGIDDMLIGAKNAYNYASGYYDAGSTYVIFGKSGATRSDIDLSALAAADGFKIEGTDYSYGAGWSVSSAGDINGDGIDDLLIGAPYAYAYASGYYDAGSTYVIFGKSGATRPDIDLSNLAAADGFKIEGAYDSDYSGWSVSSAGDINGDGIDDMLIGAKGAYNYASYYDDAGSTYVIFGKSGATRSDIDLSALAAADGFKIEGAYNSDYSGWSVSSAGDINGDGIDDLLIGAPYAYTSSYYSGYPYYYSYYYYAGSTSVIFGKSGATRSDIDLSALAAADGFRIDGADYYGRAGWSVSSAGDVNGDGIDDLLIGAPYAYAYASSSDYAGSSYVIFGKNGATRSDIDLSALAAADGFKIEGAYDSDYSGNSVSGAGDINGDGIDDMLIGAYNADPSSRNSAGSSYFILGKSGATRSDIDLSALAAADGFKIDGAADDDNSGWSVSSAGDVNGDGIDDMLIGARYADPSSRNDAGSTYVIFGNRCN